MKSLNQFITSSASRRYSLKNSRHFKEVDWEQNKNQMKIFNVWKTTKRNQNLEVIAMSKPSFTGKANVEAKNGEIEGEIGITYQDEFPDNSGEVTVDGHIDSKGNGGIEINVKKKSYAD